MAFIVQTLWAGRLHHSIEYGDAEGRPPERLGKENARLRISDRDAARGIDALVAENFSETLPPAPVDCGGEHF